MDAIRAHANVIGVSLEPDSPASRSAAVLKTWHVPLVIPLLLLALMAALPAIDHAEAQTYTGVLALDPVPSQIRSGSTVTFSGQLTTTSGHAVTGATIHIRDDVTFGRDTLIATATTDDTGRFAATWTAKSRSSGSWDFFAAYDGASNISGARSETYVVRVSSGSGPSGQTGSAAGGSTSIYLSPVPQQVYTGDSVTFTGWLASNGQPLAGKLVRIGENDPGVPDQLLGYGRTGQNGWFSITWRASAGLVETDFDVYAVFNGDSTYDRARTPDQEMSVYKRSGSITLADLPASARIGEIVEFSGTLRLDGRNPEGAVVYIKDEDPFSGDDLLATAYVDRSGRFSTYWYASDVDPDNTVDIYAVFEGNAHYSRLATCESGPTGSLGGLCRNTVPIRIRDSAPPPTPDVPPSAGEYIELYYSKDFSSKPHIVIVPSPDSYSQVSRHITPVMEGINMWVERLGQRYGGNWGVTFELMSSGKIFYDSKPDVVVNLVTYEEDGGCGTEYGGKARIFRTPPETIQTWVCSTYSKRVVPNDSVAATAGHEFVHAMGLGHAFNKPGDLMCSEEDGVPTCGRSNSNSDIPSSLNLAGIAELYGVDGFLNPNNDVNYGTQFAEGSNQNSNSGSASSGCPQGGYTYDRSIEDRTLEPRHYVWYRICSSQISYTFSTASQYTGFLLYLVTPETDVRGFINDGEGRYYTCEEYGTHWHSKSNTCNISPGAKIVLHNDGDDTLHISGRIWN